jgi:MoCo/4Fe-4S cofactor protein with predicted Tat translocation signal
MPSMSDAENTNMNAHPSSDGSSNPVTWRNIDEIAAREDFEDFLKENYPREAVILQRSGLDRRSFLKIMGATLTLSGFALQGCTTASPPNERIIPYVRVPEEVIPGQPLYFASTMVLGGYATGVLIETHEGRPHRLDGNPDHPASLGGSNAIIQANVLELYNPDRAVDVRNEGNLSSWDEFLAALESQMANIGDGTGLRLLTETVTSPTLASQIDALLEQYPGAQWHQYEPVARDNIVAGSQLAFGEVVNTTYDFSQANVIVAIDGDFLSALDGSLHYARDYAATRRVRVTAGETPEISRLYAVESTPSLTGAAADHRLKMKPSDVEWFTRALAAELGIETDFSLNDAPWDSNTLAAIVEDLRANQGASLVVAGAWQSPAVHALVHAINAELGNVGSTVVYTEPVEANPVNQTADLAALTDAMSNGDVDALFIMGGNPAFTAPNDIPFAEALADVPFSVHLGYYNDETSELCTWQIPQKHFIETWGDARAFDGTASLMQPPIGPLLDTTRSDYDMLALLTGDERSSFDILQAYWQDQYEGDDFDGFWRRALHNGVIEDTAFEPVEPTLVADVAGAVGPFDAPAGNGLEIVFQPDPFIYDGRFSQNSWLQELPKPFNKLTWDTAMFVSPATADELRLTTGMVVNLLYGTGEADATRDFDADDYTGATVQMPVWVLPEQPDGAVTVFLGYGKEGGADVEADYAFNAYAIRSSDAMNFRDGLQIARTRDMYTLANAQIELSFESYEEHPPIERASLGFFLENLDFAGYDGDTDKTLLPDYNEDYAGYQWGMTIDLSACIGCNACMVACQSENNGPSVGKSEVERGREMHWIRVDRYYDAETDETGFQPVPCMHCEQAPCEQVCPVQATVHSDEGLNQMVYNRCVGTRYCSGNCPYSVRRFNFFNYVDDTPILDELRNPNVSVRSRGVMEKCTYCVQRINSARINANNENRRINDGEVMPACAVACPTQAIVFGDIADSSTQVSQLKAQPQNYSLLGETGVRPRTTYLARLTNPNDVLHSTDAEAETEES